MSGLPCPACNQPAVERIDELPGRYVCTACTAVLVRATRRGKPYYRWVNRPNIEVIRPGDQLHGRK